MEMLSLLSVYQDSVEINEIRTNVCFQKISIPPPRRELEIPEGWGGQSPRKFQRGWGVRGEIFVQRVGSRSTFFVCQLAPFTYFSGTF